MIENLHLIPELLTVLVFSILLFKYGNEQIRRIDKKIDLMKYEDSQLWSKINLRHLESRLELLEKTQGLIFKPAKTEIKHIESRYGRLKLK
jgi:hypothetical protein